MEEATSVALAYSPGWLRTLRASALIALLPLLLAAALPAVEFVPQEIPHLRERWSTPVALTLVLLLPVSVLLPYLVILLRVGSRPRREDGLALATIVGSWWYTFCSALTSIWFIDRSTLANRSAEHVSMIWISIGIWLVVGIPHAVLLTSTMKALKLSNHGASGALEPHSGLPWPRLMRITAAASMLFLVFPNLFLFPTLKQIISTSGLVLLGLMVLASEAPYLVLFRSAPGFSPNRVPDLGVGLASGWMILFAMAGLFHLISGGALLVRVHLGWTLPGFWVPFALTQAGLLASSLKTRQAASKIGGQGPIAWENMVLPVLPTLCFAFFLVVFVAYAAGE